MIKLKSLLKEETQINVEIDKFLSQLKSKYSSVLQQLHFRYDSMTKGIFLSGIYIKPEFRGRGYGSKIMKDLCDFANKNKLFITLVPAAESIRPEASRRLITFYRKFGFNIARGLPVHNSDDIAMVRAPKASLNEQQKRWSAIVLDEKSKNELLSTYKNEIPEGWEIIAHHMTINPFGLTDDVGRHVPLKVIAVGNNDKAFAVKVSGYDRKTNNAFPHITIAINRAGGGKPKDSNTITNWKSIDGINLEGTVENL